MAPRFLLRIEELGVSRAEHLQLARDMRTREKDNTDLREEALRKAERGLASRVPGPSSRDRVAA